MFRARGDAALCQITSTARCCVTTDITELYRELSTADLSVTGGSCKLKRTTLLRAATLNVSRDSSAFMHLLSLRRSLKVPVIC